MKRFEKVSVSLKSISLIFLLASVFVVAFIFLKNDGSYKGRSTKIGNNELLDLCGIEEIPENVNVKEDPLTVNLINEQVDWTGGNSIYSNKDFTLVYPSSRKIYNENDGFFMCPPEGCQDFEMYVGTVDKSDTNKCSVARSVFSLPSIGDTTFWSNFSLGPYEGIAVTSFPKSERPFDQIPTPVLYGVISADNGKVYEIRIDPRNNTLVTILGSFVPR